MGVCYGINLNHRFTPRLAWRNLGWMRGRLGHLLFTNMAMWIMNPAETSPYYHIKSLHPHTVDVMRYFCGDVEAVHCFATKAPGPANLVHRAVQFPLPQWNRRHIDWQL